MTESGEFCWRTGKRMYGSKGETVRATRGLKETYPYRCDDCGAFHFAKRRKTPDQLARRQERIVE